MAEAAANTLDALRELRSATMESRDPQRALSALVRMTPERLASVLSDISRAAAASVNAPAVDVAAVEHVELLRDAARAFVGEEEVLSALCRVLASACRLSRRFQRQAGRLELWRELSHLRAVHPSSRRVLLASLGASTAILSACDLNTMALLLSSSLPQPSRSGISAAELLLEELLQLLLRFGDRHGVDPLAVTTATDQRQVDMEVAVAAVRLMATVLSGPSTGSGDPLSLLLERFSASISSALLRNLARCRDASRRRDDQDDAGDQDHDHDHADPMGAWLAACRELMRLLRPADTHALLFRPASAPSDGHAPSPWYEAIAIDCRERLARRRDDRYRRLLLVYLSAMTRLFALPHSRDDHECQSILATILRSHPCVVDALCALVSEHHHRASSNNREIASRDADADAVVLLELLRLLHLWSARGLGAELMAQRESVRETLAPVLADMLTRLLVQQRGTEHVHQHRREPTRERVVMAQASLAALLVAQRLLSTTGGGPKRLRAAVQQAASGPPRPSPQLPAIHPARRPAATPGSAAEAPSSSPSPSPPPSASPTHAIHGLALPTDGFDDDSSLGALLARELAATVALLPPSTPGQLGSMSTRLGMESSPFGGRGRRRRRRRGDSLVHGLKASTVAVYSSHA